MCSTWGQCKYPVLCAFYFLLLLYFVAPWAKEAEAVTAPGGLLVYVYMETNLSESIRPPTDQKTNQARFVEEGVDKRTSSLDTVPPPNNVWKFARQDREMQDFSSSMKTV